MCYFVLSTAAMSRCCSNNICLFSLAYSLFSSYLARYELILLTMNLHPPRRTWVLSEASTQPCFATPASYPPAATALVGTHLRTYQITAKEFLESNTRCIVGYAIVLSIATWYCLQWGNRISSPSINFGSRLN